MILGAGKFQVPVIELARDMGFETLVVSKAGDYPGFKIADKYREVDVRQAAAILKLARAERVCGILTDQTDLPVPTVAYVAEKMGLPGIGFDCARRITNKLFNRQHCRKIGFPVPQFAPCLTCEEVVESSINIGYPLVVKPSDSQGARGVSRVDQPDGLSAAFRSAFANSLSGIILVEEFLPGRMIWMSGFLSDGRYTNLLLGDTECFDIPEKFIHKQSMHPAILSGELKHRFLALDRKLFQSFGADFGMTFSQYILDDVSGDIRLVEAALRSAAGFTSSHLVPLARGINILSMLIELTTGLKKRVDIPEAELCDRAVGNVYFSLPPGTILRVEGLKQLGVLPGVDKVELEGLVIGARVSETNDSTDTYGPILFSGENRQRCESIVRVIRETLKVEVKCQDGIKSMEWF